jgi:predicted secreted acid phosphatase
MINPIQRIQVKEEEEIKSVTKEGLKTLFFKTQAKWKDHLSNSENNHLFLTAFPDASTLSEFLNSYLDSIENFFKKYPKLRSKYNPAAVFDIDNTLINDSEDNDDEVSIEIENLISQDPNFESAKNIWDKTKDLNQIKEYIPNKLFTKLKRLRRKESKQEKSIYNTKIQSVVKAVRNIYYRLLSMEVPVFLITARPDDPETRLLTQKELEQVGVIRYQELYMMPSSLYEGATGYIIGYFKSEQRNKVTEGHQIILNVGDQWTDLFRLEQFESFLKNQGLLEKALPEDYVYASNMFIDSWLSVKLISSPILN